MAPHDPRIGTVLAGRYRIESQLGAGGMGVVYRAVRLDADRTVAIKFLLDNAPEFLARFQREVAAASRLSHPHLADIIDSGFVDGLPYLVMEFVPGQSLKRLLAQGPIAAPRAVGLIRQILAGIRHAHTGGVVHRDLKPDNVLLVAGPNGDSIKVLDFGLAKIVRGAGERQNLTVQGIAMGTPGYIAPEQAQAEPADPRADLYSIGIMLYEMVVGRKPFVSDSPAEVVRMHIFATPVPPRTAAGDACCSPALEAIILRALEKQPARRFATAKEFAEALDKTPEARGRVEEPLVTVAPIRRAREEVREVKGSKPKPADDPGPLEVPLHPRPWWIRATILAIVLATVGALAAGIVPLPSCASAAGVASPDPRRTLPSDRRER